MEILWGIAAIALAAIFVGVAGVSVVQGMRTHRRDSQIVRMRNLGRSVSEIAEALGMRDEDVRRSMKRISGSVGPSTGIP